MAEIKLLIWVIFFNIQASEASYFSDIFGWFSNTVCIIISLKLMNHFEKNAGGLKCRFTQRNNSIMNSWNFQSRKKIWKRLNFVSVLFFVGLVVWVWIMQYVNRSRILAQDFRECTCFWARFSLEAGVSGSAFQCLLEFIFKLTDKNNNKTSKIKSLRRFTTSRR